MASFLLDDLKRQIDFTDTDARRLRDLAPAIRDRLPTVVERFYARLFADPEALAVFSEGPEQIERQKRVFSEWLAELFDGRYDDACFESRVRIGRTHVRVGLPQFRMFTAIEMVRQELTAEIRRIGLSKARPGLPETRPGSPDPDAVIDSLEKLLMIELTAMVESYTSGHTMNVRQEERDLAEEKLIKSEHFAQLGQMAAALAHEIKNPLAAISSVLQVIRDSMPDSDSRRDVMNEALGQIERLDSAVKDLLVYARPKSVSAHPCDLRNVVERVIRLIRETPAFRGVDCTLETEDELPPVHADERQIEQVMLNLLYNAAHATTENGRVTVELSHANDVARITIRDNGHGMDDETLERAFEPFFTTRSKGTGLGLPICLQIVEAHGGTIQLANRPEGGLHVTVELPMKPAPR